MKLVFELLTRSQMLWGHHVMDLLNKIPTLPGNDVLARRFRETTQPNRHMKVMWYCQDERIVLVGMEHHKERKEWLADEAPFNSDPPLYFSEDGHCVSPVYRLKLLRDEVKKMLKSQGLFDGSIWIAYITNNRIINKEEMIKNVWIPDRVLVFDHVLDLSPDFCVENTPPQHWGLEAFQYADEHTKWDFTTTQKAGEEDDVEEDEEEDEVDDEEEEEEKASDDTDDPLFGSLDDFHKTFPEVPRLEEGTRAEILWRMENPEDVFKGLIGCQEIREQIRQLTTLHRYNLRRRIYNPNAPQHAVNLHAIFHGSPGTGKTTLCRLYASLLFKAGALSSGHVVVASRSTFLGTNFGDEEKAVHAVLKAAKGGVLMIDEAYLLNPPHPNDPGKHVLQLMMPVLADENMRDLAIVLCGYTEPMERLLSLNEGLASRFPNRFKFPDFTVPQLLDISKLRIKTFNYHFTPKAWKLYKEMLTQLYEHRDKKKWSNAREVAHLLDKIYIHHATRCMKAPDPKKMSAITVADIKPVESTLTFQPQHRIGFR